MKKIAVILTLILCMTSLCACFDDYDYSMSEIESMLSDESNNSVDIADDVKFTATLANDDFDPAAYEFYKDPDDVPSPGPIIIYRPDGVVKNFRFFEITTPDAKQYVITKVLYSCETISQNNPFAAETQLDDKLPLRGISYEDANGVTHYYSIMDSAIDGSLLFNKDERISESIESLYETAKLGANRDLGDLQPETLEIVECDGKLYQSYVASSHDMRYVFVSNKEFSMSASWDWVAIGTKTDYSIKNLGKISEDLS